MLRQEIAFFDSKDAGSPSVKVTTTANLVNQGISEKLSLTIQGLSTFATAFILAFAVQWKLTLITISIVPTILIVTAICVGIDAQQDGKILSIYSQAGLLAEEVFASITTVHAFWLQPVMRSRYDALLEDAETVGWRKSPNWAVMFSIEFFCIYSGYGLAFWQGIRMYTSGEIEEAGKVVTYVPVAPVSARRKLMRVVVSSSPSSLQLPRSPNWHLSFCKSPRPSRLLMNYSRPSIGSPISTLYPRTGLLPKSAKVTSRSKTWNSHTRRDRMR